MIGVKRELDAGPVEAEPNKQSEHLITSRGGQDLIHHRQLNSSLFKPRFFASRLHA
jgi:hypothetical protein